MSQHSCFAPTSRRSFLKNLGSTVAVTTATTALNASAFAQKEDQVIDNPSVSQPKETGSIRADSAYQRRLDAAIFQRNQPAPPRYVNGDEHELPGFIGNFTKSLPHNALGEVDPNAYNSLLAAVASGDPADFAAIPRGGAVKLANPQAALAYSMEGADSHYFSIRPAYKFDSLETGGEMAELYWQALTRDVPFSQYGENALINAMIRDMRRFPQFRSLTPDNAFRGPTVGDYTGPYISQFLWKPIPYGALTIDQRYRVPVAGDDRMTGFAEWLAIQNGSPAAAGNNFDSALRYIRNNRDLGEWDHRDFSYQGFLNAALIILAWGGDALADNNPYKTSANQGGFVQFGGPHILDLVARAALAALKAAWCEKWISHRHIRPEEYGGRVHNAMSGASAYPVSKGLLNSSVLAEVYSRHGSYLLPMAYPEGCPTHPAYPSGHATIAGACATMLKAFFKESFEVPSPVTSSDDGLSLQPYSGGLTIGGEINKLASNVAIGRNAAGVHWRSDALQGMYLGEAVSISILKDYRQTYNESFGGFTLTKFDGSVVTI